MTGQKSTVMNHMLKYGSISPIEAFEKYKITRLMDGYDRLAIGIVSLAANDYRAVLRGLAAERSVYERRMLLGQKKELERFFLSDYGDDLCYGR